MISNGVKYTFLILQATVNTWLDQILKIFCYSEKSTIIKYDRHIIQQEYIIILLWL